MKEILLYITVCVALFFFTCTFAQKVIIRDFNKTGKTQALMEKSQNEAKHESYLSRLPLPDTSKMFRKKCVIFNANDSTKRSSVNNAKLGKALHYWNLAR